MAASGTGVLIIRVWVEEGSAEPLRAHLRMTNDITSDIERSMALTRPDTVCRVVWDWLEEMVTDPG